MSLDVYLISKTPISKKQSSGIFIRENGETKEISLSEWNKRNPNVEPVSVIQDDENEFETNELFSANITHNLAEMASEAGVYDALWRPYRLKGEYVETDNYDDEMKFENSQVISAKELIDPMREGLHKLKSDPDKYEKFNPENGWGSYDGLIRFIEKYLNACYENQSANVEVSR